MRRIPAVLILTATLLLAACGGPDLPPPNGRVAELTLIDETVGDGEEAKSGMEVTVHYTGWIFDQDAPRQRGAKFDSSRDRGQPFTFPLDRGRVIRGWDEGVQGMRVGGRRVLLIPPEYGYGSRGAGGVIPPNASLVFEVELVAITGR
ncbi:FKBP-type peptidyl-prolyl cis-trans isomerase FkpA [Rehaibacterium terrae]|jgi:FKBP-type peptidyl-prolyl cis-trans isomerase FkpA|uniref:Peptidyl-prolyl cis-trans isomerase n=1 Tax=Rehaibacterium terrae TaxID=1341696 RepID=A0A7W8DEZ9_9GAMM|nr:FKBP-type peptidyl-prolyl cis-trans isomerase [Rehaibacterium terrae]MBB5015991.1 FKBP-type peptidyl-prolyl cis-trans isomerase FkpA [Rehaibacterium terrae]